MYVQPRWLVLKCAKTFTSCKILSKIKTNLNICNNFCSIISKRRASNENSWWIHKKRGNRASILRTYWVHMCYGTQTPTHDDDFSLQSSIIKTKEYLRVFSSFLPSLALFISFGKGTLHIQPHSYTLPFSEAKRYIVRQTKRLSDRRRDTFVSNILFLAWWCMQQHAKLMAIKYIVYFWANDIHLKNRKT